MHYRSEVIVQGRSPSFTIYPVRKNPIKQRRNVTNELYNFTSTFIRAYPELVLIFKNYYPQVTCGENDFNFPNFILLILLSDSNYVDLWEKIFITVVFCGCSLEFLERFVLYCIVLIWDAVMVGYMKTYWSNCVWNYIS